MSVTPSPIGGFAAQFFDNNGVILSGGKIYTYAAGTTTPQATYTSASGTTPHANPIILDSAGRVPGGEIWLTDGLVYKFVIETATGILLGTYDNITGVNSNFVNYTVQEEVITATAGQTVFNLSTINYTPGTNSLSVYIDGVNQYVGDSYLETDSDTVTFTSGVHVGGEVKFTTAVQSTTGAVDASIVSYEPPYTGSVATNVEAKLAQYVSVADFGAVGDGTTDDAAAIQAAMTAADGGVLTFGAGLTYLLEDEILVPANTTVELNGATINFDVVGSVYCFKMGNDSVIQNGTINQINTANEVGVNGSFRCPITVGSFNAGFASQGARNVTIQNLELSNSRPVGQCISVYSDSFNVLIQNCAINDGGGAKNGLACHWSLDTGTPADGTQHPSAIRVVNCVFADFDVGVYLSAAYQVSIENCKFLDCGKGVEAYRGDYSNVYAPVAIQPFVNREIRVTNSQMRGCAIAVEIDGIEGLTAPQSIMSVDVIGCQLFGPTSGTANDRGFYIRGTSRGSIRDCIISEFDGYGIDFVGSAENYVIDNCTINGNELAGIYSRDTDLITDVNISNCRIYGNAASSGLATKPGVRIGSLCQNWEVKNCAFGTSVGESQATSVAIEPTSQYISLVNNHTYGVVDYAYRVTGATSFATSSTLQLNFVGNTADAGIVVYDGSPCATVVGPALRQMWYNAAPTVGAWRVGDIIWNTSAAAGGTVGWVCTTAGTPGTWKTFGAIAA